MTDRVGDHRRRLGQIAARCRGIDGRLNPTKQAVEPFSGLAIIQANSKTRPPRWRQKSNSHQHIMMNLNRIV